MPHVFKRPFSKEELLDARGLRLYMPWFSFYKE